MVVIVAGRYARVQQINHFYIRALRNCISITYEIFVTSFLL